MFRYYFKVHKTNLIVPPLFIEVSVPSQENELSYICALGISTFPLFLWSLHYTVQLLRHFIFIAIHFKVRYVKTNAYFNFDYVDLVKNYSVCTLPTTITFIYSGNTVHRWCAIMVQHRSKYYCFSRDIFVIRSLNSTY